MLLVPLVVVHLFVSYCIEEEPQVPAGPDVDRRSLISGAWAQALQGRASAGGKGVGSPSSLFGEMNQLKGLCICRLETEAWCPSDILHLQGHSGG